MRNIVRSLLTIGLFVFGFLHVQLISQYDDSKGYWNKTEYSCEVQDSPNPLRGENHWVLYEFDKAQVLESSFGWNDISKHSMHIGAKEVIVDYLVSDNEWVEWGVFEFPKAPEKNQYQGFSGPSFGGKKIKMILLSVVNTHQETECPFIPELDFGVNSQIDMKSSKEQDALPFEDGIARVFPNPVLSHLNIQVEKKLVEGAKIHLLDTTGREMLTSNHLILAEDQMIQLNIENCLPGLLVLVIQSGNEIYTHKIIKV